MRLTFYKLYNMHINQHGASHSMLNYQYKQINKKKQSINYTDGKLITRVKIHQGIIPTHLKEISTETLWTSTEVYISISIYIKNTAFYIQTHGASFLKENVFTASLQYWIILNWIEGRMLMQPGLKTRIQKRNKSFIICSFSLHGILHAIQQKPINGSLYL